MQLKSTAISLNNPSAIYTLDISPDGKYLIIGQVGDFPGGIIGNLTLWRLPELELLGEIESFYYDAGELHFERIGCVRFTHDSKKLVFTIAELSKSQDIYWYDLENQDLTIVPSFSAEIAWIAAARESPRIVTSGQTVEVWRTNPFQNIFRSVGGYIARSSWNLAPAALTADGKYLAVAGIDSDRVLIYDVDRQTIIRSLADGPLTAQWTIFSPDSQYLAVIAKTSEWNISVWDLEENIDTPKFSTSFSTYLCLRFHPRGKYLAGGTYSGCISILQLEDGESVVFKRIHNGRIYDLAFTPDGTKIFSGGDDGLLRITELIY